MYIFFKFVYFLFLRNSYLCHKIYQCFYRSLFTVTVNIRLVVSRITLNFLTLGLFLVYPYLWGGKEEEEVRIWSESVTIFSGNIIFSTAGSKHERGCGDVSECVLF